MDVDVNGVVRRLASQVSDLVVRLAVAEAQLEAYQQADVHRIAAEENAHDAE
jgi:hypothetical protein